MSQSTSACRQGKFWHVLLAFLLLLPPFLLSPSTAQADDPPPSPKLTITGTVAGGTAGSGTMNVMNGSTVTVNVNLVDAAANDVSSVNFSLDFNETCLSFAGYPAAVTFPGLALHYVPSVTYNATDTDGEIDVNIYDGDDPQTAFSDGVLATFTFGVQASCRAADGTHADGNTQPVVFGFDTTPSAPTYGDTAGHAVSGNISEGANYTLRFNARPTAMALSTAEVAENVALRTNIGDFSATDFDTVTPGDTHTFALVAGEGGGDNGAFDIDGTALKTNTQLNFEADNSYSIRVRATDSYGGWYEEAFAITVSDVNEAPTSITIDDSSVDENQSDTSEVGTFSTTDPDGDTVTYSLVAGAGDPDNGSFTLNSDTGALSFNVADLNYEVKNTYSIRVQASDGNGGTLVNIFSIRVNDVEETPVAVADVLDPDKEVISAAKNIYVLVNDTDDDLGDVLQVESVTEPDSGTATDNDAYITYTPAAYFNGPVTFSYVASDGALPSNSANVTFNVVANDDRGDCNSDDNVDAGDFPAFVLEFNDTDESNAWYKTYTGSFAGSPKGCDANADLTVGAGDLACMVLVTFGNTACTDPSLVAAGAAASAELAVGQNLVATPDGSVVVPVSLNTNGQSIAAARFSLDFDASQLGFDSTDADGNGVPDAIKFQVPAGMMTAVSNDAEAGDLHVTVYAASLPMPTLADGVVANITLQVNPDAAAVETPIALVKSSLGSDQGQSVPVQVKDGMLRIAKAGSFLFLPLLNH